jgi:hypothetical protein
MIKNRSIAYSRLQVSENPFWIRNNSPKSTSVKSSSAPSSRVRVGIFTIRLTVSSLNVFYRLEGAMDAALAFNGLGLFGLQHTVCYPRAAKWRHTVDILKTGFRHWDDILQPP